MRFDGDNEVQPIKELFRSLSEKYPLDIENVPDWTAAIKAAATILAETGATISGAISMVLSDLANKYKEPKKSDA
jgi:hypothetical protein